MGTAMPIPGVEQMHLAAGQGTKQKVPLNTVWRQSKAGLGRHHESLVASFRLKKGNSVYREDLSLYINYYGKQS